MDTGRTISDTQKQALQMVSDCGWGVKSTDGVSLIEVPTHEGEFREILDAVFGQSVESDETTLPSGQDVQNLGLAFEELPAGWYLAQVDQQRPEGFGFDEVRGEMGSLESADQIEVRGPLAREAAVGLYTELGGE